MDQYGNVRHTVTFSRLDCAACPCRTQCTRAVCAPRTVELRDQAVHEALQAARARQATPDFRARYAQRAGIEGTLEQGIRIAGLRCARYLGSLKTHLQHLLTAAALDLVRVMAWLEETPRATTRVSHFAQLVPQPIAVAPTT